VDDRTDDCAFGATMNPDKVSCIYARNPFMHSLMSKSPPIDNLAPLAKAGVAIIHDCGGLDPWLDDQTRVVEKRYKELGGQITVIVRKGVGHFPLEPKDPEPVIDFILSPQKPSGFCAASCVFCVVRNERCGFRRCEWTVPM
jgi:hypothetical protein